MMLTKCTTKRTCRYSIIKECTNTVLSLCCYVHTINHMPNFPKLSAETHAVDVKKECTEGSRRMIHSVKQYTGFVVIPQYCFLMPSNFPNTDHSSVK